MTTSSGHEDADLADGVIRWFDPNRGYGFVAPSLNAPKSDDIFLHGQFFDRPVDTQVRWPVGTPVKYKKRISEKTGRPEVYTLQILR